jgi:hypothetical protein
MKISNILPIFAAMACLPAVLVLAQPVQAPKANLRPSSVAPAKGKVVVPKESAEQDRLPVVVHLETRDRLITIKAGQHGRVYTVRDKAGRLIHRELPERDLQAKAPELYDWIKNALANGPRLDARLRDAHTR